MATHQSISISKRKKRECEAGHCSQREGHFYQWPSNEKVAEKWTAWVRLKRANFVPDKYSTLCYKHFQDDAFTNIGFYKAGVVKKLILEKDAVPTIHMTESTKQQEALGIELATQELTPRKRSAVMPTPTAQRQLLRTDPVDLQLLATKASASKMPRRKVSATVVAEVAVPSADEKQAEDTTAMPDQSDVAVPVRPSTLEVPQQKQSSDSAVATSSTAAASYSTPTPNTSSTSEMECPASDPDWLPGDEDYEEDEEEMSSPTDGPRKGKWFDEPKFIVTESKLKQLMGTCNVCGGFAEAEQTLQMGAHVEYRIRCQHTACGKERTWCNGDVVNQIYVINLLLSASLLFTGGLLTKFFRALSSIRILIPDIRTFYRHQREYLHGIVRSVYTAKQEAVIQAIISGGPVHLSGDGRADSPGHSALYGVYTMMCSNTGKVLCFELVKSTEVGSSNAMEMEGLIRCRNQLERLLVSVTSLTTDRHIQIQAYMNKSWSEVQHFYDTWHISKGLKKKLAAVSAKKQHSVLSKWIKSITNHLYWVIDTTDHNTELRRQKWLSILDHLADIHAFDSTIFPACEHEELENEEKDADGNLICRPWILEGSPTHKELKPIITDRNLIKALNKAGKDNTSELESYHSSLNHNAPKMIGFSYSGMVTRVQITAMHQNENCQRPIQLNQDGTPIYRVVRKKATKLEPTVTTIRVPATYTYVDDMMLELENHMVSQTKPRLEDREVSTLASKGSQVPKEHLIAAQQSRGLKLKPSYL